MHQRINRSENIITGYHPYDNGKNEYLQVSEQAIRKAGYKVVKMNKQSVFKSFFHMKNAMKLVNFNWYDEITADSRLKMMLTTIKRKCIIWTLKVSGVKIVVTVHNRVPHSEKGYVNSKFRMWMLKHSDAVVQLSEDTAVILEERSGKYWEKLKNKLYTIPHPNYISSIHEYSHSMREAMGWGREEFVVLSTGFIKPYKNIEIIIQAAKQLNEIKNIHFYVVGKASDMDYAEQLKRQVGKQTNIKFDFRFAEKEELHALMEAADICLYPYNIRSSLNSGNCLLCCSLGKTCIIPEIGTVHEINSPDVFSYSYENEQEHMEAVVDKIKEAYYEWKNQPEEFAQRGKRLKMLVQERYSVEETAKKYHQLYSKLLGSD